MGRKCPNVSPICWWTSCFPSMLDTNAWFQLFTVWSVTLLTCHSLGDHLGCIFLVGKMFIPYILILDISLPKMFKKKMCSHAKFFFFSPTHDNWFVELIRNSAAFSKWVACFILQVDLRNQDSNQITTQFHRCTVKISTETNLILYSS